LSVPYKDTSLETAHKGSNDLEQTKHLVLSLMIDPPPEQKIATSIQLAASPLESKK